MIDTTSPRETIRADRANIANRTIQSTTNWVDETYGICCWKGSAEGAEQFARGRKVWVYVQFTDKYDVQGRLEGLIQEAGLRVGVLRSSVSLARREDWIAEHAPQLDAVIS